MLYVRREGGEKERTGKECFPADSLERCKRLVLLERFPNRSCALSADDVFVDTVQWNDAQMRVAHRGG